MLVGRHGADCIGEEVALVVSRGVLEIKVRVLPLAPMVHVEEDVRVLEVVVVVLPAVVQPTPAQHFVVFVGRD